MIGLFAASSGEIAKGIVPLAQVCFPSLSLTPGPRLCCHPRMAKKKTILPKKKVLIPIGDATEVMDTLYPIFRLPEDGFEAVVCGPEARLYHGVLHEIPPTAEGEPKWDITRESPAYHVRATVAFRDVKPEEYCGLFISGGRAPEYLRYDQDLLRITRHFFAANKPVASVCHGIEILTAADVIKGRTVTTVAKCELDAVQGGAKYVNQRVVVDGNLVCSRVWMDNTWLMKEFMAMLKRYVGE